MVIHIRCWLFRIWDTISGDEDATSDVLEEVVTSSILEGNPTRSDLSIELVPRFLDVITALDSVIA